VLSPTTYEPATYENLQPLACPVLTSLSLVYRWAVNNNPAKKVALTTHYPGFNCWKPGENIALTTHYSALKHHYDR